MPPSGKKKRRIKFKARPKYPIRINGIVLRVSRQVVLTVVSDKRILEIKKDAPNEASENH